MEDRLAELVVENEKLKKMNIHLAREVEALQKRNDILSHIQKNVEAEVYDFVYGLIKSDIVRREIMNFEEYDELGRS